MKLVTILASLISVLPSVSLSQEASSITAVRHGFGYNFVGDSLVVRDAITDRRDKNTSNRREIPTLPDECFIPPGITEVSGIERLRSASHFFRALRLAELYSLPIEINCGESSIKTTSYFEAEVDDSDWVILNVPSDQFLLSLSNEFISIRYSLNRFEEIGYSVREKSAGRVRVELEGRDLFGFAAINGWYYAAVFPQKKDVQEGIAARLQQLGYVSQFQVNSDDELVVLARLVEVEPESFYPSLKRALALAARLGIIEKVISNESLAPEEYSDTDSRIAAAFRNSVFDD